MMSAESTATVQARDLFGKVAGKMRRHAFFAAVVLVPTLASTIYFTALAPDVFVSTSSFVVRSPQRQGTSGIGALLQGAGLTGFSKATDDVYAVNEFLVSRDALLQLDARWPHSGFLGEAGLDMFTRMSAWGYADSFEGRYRYYQSRVQLDTDTASSISTLTVKSATSSQAAKVNETLLELAEQRVNELNERGRKDLIRFASAEAEVAVQRARDAALALAGYRDANVVSDPERQATLQLQGIAKLQEALIVVKQNLARFRAFTPDNPQLPALMLEEKGLQAEIDRQTAAITGKRGSLASKAVQYERLMLDRDIADKQLALAMASLQQARNDADRKQLYLERVVQPAVPDKAIEPRRLRGILATLAMSLIAWGVLSILIAGVREHRD